MFKSILRFVGLCLFLIFIGGNVWAGTLSSSDPCYGKYYTGPGGGSISCNEEGSYGKCFQVSANKCEFWCKGSSYFRAVEDMSVSDVSQITSNMKWVCLAGQKLSGSCGTQKTSYDGQTYYQNESYLDCKKDIYIGIDAPALAGQSYAYVRFKVNPDFTACPGGPSGCSYGFDVKANKPWNPYSIDYDYPDWIFDSRGYRCGAGTRINSSAQLCAYDSGTVGRISGSSCVKTSSVLSAQPYCSACADGTYNSSYTTSTSCTTVPANSTANSDKTDFICNADYIKFYGGCNRCPYGGATNPLTSPDSSIQNNSYFTAIADGVNNPNSGTWELAEPGRSSNGTSCLIEYTGSDTTGTYSTGSCTLNDSSLINGSYYITIDWYGYQGAGDDFRKYRSLICSNGESTQPRGQGEGYCVDGYYGMGTFIETFRNVFPGCSTDESYLFLNNDGHYGLQAYCDSMYAAQFFLSHLYSGGRVVGFYVD